MIYGNNLSAEGGGGFRVLDKIRESVYSKENCSTNLSHNTKTF